MTEPRIYIGPQLPGWGLHFGTVFSGKLPETVLAIIERCPETKGLIVPVSRTNTSREAVKRKGTMLNTRYAAVKAAYESEKR